MISFIHVKKIYDIAPKALLLSEYSPESQTLSGRTVQAGN
jgi:hypothetical protein